MTYQKVTGTLSPGAHCGSYNGQDAYNDMLIVEDGNEDIFNAEDRRIQGIKCGEYPEGTGPQGCDRLNSRPRGVKRVMMITQMNYISSEGLRP